MDDHYQKLFWAFFLPSFASNRISPQELEGARQLAKRMHGKRLDSLYVSPDANDALIEIPKAEAENTIQFAEARLGIEEGVSIEPPSPEKLQDLQQWLLDALADDEKKRFIFSSKSVAKLQADNSVSSWIKWLRQTFHEQEEEMKGLLAKELEKQMPTDKEASKDKWKIKIRFLCVSHSVRQKALNCWNDQVKWIKLFEADKRKRQVIAEIHLPEAVPLQALWHAGYGETRRLLLALNIGSLGFWWWYSLNRENHFYEEIVDVQKGVNLDIAEQNPYLYVDWGKHALSERDLQHAMLCYSFLPGPRATEREQRPFGEYLTALAFLGKTDLHLNLTVNACALLFRCLKDAMQLYGDMREGEEFSEAFRRNLSWIITEEADRTSFVELFASLEHAEEQREFSELTLDKVLQTKALCDAYFLRVFERKARQLANHNPESAPTSATHDDSA